MRAHEHRKEKETNNNKINVQDKTYNNQEKRINRQTEQTKDETEEISALFRVSKLLFNHNQVDFSLS